MPSFQWSAEILVWTSLLYMQLQQGDPGKCSLQLNVIYIAADTISRCFILSGKELK